MKLLKILLLMFVILLVSQGVVSAAQDLVLEVQFFYSQTCPICASEKAFLNRLKEEYPEVLFNFYPVEDKENLNLLLDLYTKYNVPSFEQGAVPITFIGEDYFAGFDSSIGQEIKSSIQRQIPIEQVEEPIPEEPIPERKPPLFGQIDVEKYSLPALAVTLGFIDGFNVCSLGAIILILSMVLALKSRRLTLIAGGTFILVTAIVYGLLILLWYQLFSLLVPWARVMQIVIGLIIIGGGLYFVKEFFRLKKYGAVCPVSKGRIYIWATRWIENLFKEPKKIIFLVGGILLFAAIITIIEFPCSAVVPLVFAGILAEAQLPPFLTLSYLGLFLLFYMLDEIIVFLAAVFTMKIWLTSPKFLTWFHLFAAIALFLLGGYYLIGL